MNVSFVCSRIIRIAFFLLFALTPLVLTPWNYELFEYNKMMLTYGLTTIIITAWVIQMIGHREIRIAKTPLDIPIALFGLSQLISSLFSIDPHVSWFGYYSRFNGGMWSIIAYIMLYYAFVTHFGVFEKHAQKQKNGEPYPYLPLLKAAIISGTVVALYGVAERLGVDKHLWVQDVQNRVFSTLGQPNWLAAYLVALSPVTWAFSLATIRKDTVLRFLWSAVSILFFVVLLFTRSRSGLVAFLVADIVFWGLLFLQYRKTQKATQKGASESAKTNQSLALKWGGWIHGAFALILFVNGTNITQLDRYFSLQGVMDLASRKTAAPAPAAPTAPVLESGGTESGTIRKYVWLGAINAWRSSPKTLFIGTGTETFAFAFYQFRPAEHNLTSEWDFLYNKAHNEYLNYLATTGALGLGAYLLLLACFIIWFAKNAKVKHAEIPIALFSGWTSILVTNFFGFSVVIVQLFLLLFPALLWIFITHAHEKQPTYHRFPFSLPHWATLITGIAGAILLFRIASLWYADTLFASGYRLNRSGSYQQAIEKIDRAIAINPTEPLYRDEIATPLITLAVAAMEQQNATVASNLVRRALTQSDRAIQISPRNANFWKTRTKVYYSLAGADSQFNDAAIVALTHARDLSPNDPKIYYNLAILEGRAGNPTKAIEHLARAVALKKDYRDAHYGLYVFYADMKKIKEARDVLTNYLNTVDPNDKNFREILEKSQ